MPVSPVELPTASGRLLVTDFDGTATRYDFFERALARPEAAAAMHFWDDYVAGRRTHFEALQGIFAQLRGGEEAFLEIASQTQLDSRFGESVERLRAGGWDLVIVSAGCQWYIDRLLARQRVRVQVISNPGRIDPQGRLQMELPSESPFFSHDLGVDKMAVMRAALESCSEAAFAGDGRPDLQAALLAAPRLRFARGWLAEELASRGEVFQPFDRWSEIVEALLAP